MKLHHIIYIIICSLLLTGCSSRSGPDLSPEASSKNVKNVPDWFINTPQKEGYRYTTSTATSQDIFNLVAGSYAVLVTDANGNMTTTNYIVNDEDT